jgi:hypothetical protein
MKPKNKAVKAKPFKPAVFDCTLLQAARFLACSNTCLNRANYERIGPDEVEHIYEAGSVLKPKSGRGYFRSGRFSCGC